MEKVTKLVVGQIYIYTPNNQQVVLKSIRDAERVFVVPINDNPDIVENYQNYTGQLTNISDLSNVQ